MRLRRAVAPLLLLLLLAPPGSAEAQAVRSPLEICTDEAGAGEILRRLDGWMSTARISHRALGVCEEGNSYVGRFLGVRGQTVFVLRNPTGGHLRQSLPWLKETPTPLAEIDRQQRLPQFSLLLESLLAEDRLGLALPPPPVPPQPPVARPPEETPARTKPPPRREPPRPPPPVEPPEEEVVDAAEPEEEEEELPILDLRPDEDEEEEEPPWEEVPLSRQLGIDELLVPVPEPWRWEAEAFGAVRARAPNFLAPEAGLGLGHGPFAFRLGFQIPTRWYLEDRPLGVTALWGALGLRQYGRLGASEIGLALNLTTEWLWVERLDMPEARTHAYADLGLSLVGELRFPLFGGKMGVGAEIGGMPTARTIRLPEGGSTVLGGVWGRLSIRWGLGG